MGKFEKLVVLTVLFAAALVLAIAMNRGKKDEVLASGPLGAVQQVLESEESARPLPETNLSPGRNSDAPARTDLAQERGESLLLNAGAESKRDGVLESQPKASTGGLPHAVPAAGGSSSLTLDPGSDTTRRILTDTNGLRPSFLDDYMVYVAVEGDSWSALAQRFYQDGRYTLNLRRANDDLDELRPGTEVLVPVFDLLQEEAGLQAGELTLAGAAEAPSAQATEPGKKPVVPAAGSGKKLLEYEVQPGDTLSDISLAVFGTATRWKEIFDANRDKLQKPEWLLAGMKLKIPEGGKLPVATAKAEPKPKTAQAPTQAAQPKKKKVL